MAVIEDVNGRLVNVAREVELSIHVVQVGVQEMALVLDFSPLVVGGGSQSQAPAREQTLKCRCLSRIPYDDAPVYKEGMPLFVAEQQ